MGKNYFKKMNDVSASRFWINNPNMADMENALEQGAVSCTTNPAYCAKLLSNDNDYITGVIDEVIKTVPDIDAAADDVVRTVSKRLTDYLKKQYEESGGTAGFVTIQDDPRKDTDATATIAAVLRNRKIGDNYMAKIPVIPGGIEAIEACVEHNIPICATEVFSIAQAMLICEKYEAAVKKYGNRPPIYVTHISGIFDEYLKKTADRLGIEIDSEILDQAGLTIARKQYRMMKERGYSAILLGGGARNTGHLTGIMGGDAHVTVNWSTVDEVLNSDVDFSDMLATPEDPEAVKELSDKFPDFVKAYSEEGLSVDEFIDYGPVQQFRNAFLNGWYLLLAAIAKRKTVYAL